MIIDAHAHIFNTLSGFGADGELRALDNGMAIWSDGTETRILPECYSDTVFPIERLIDVMNSNSIDKAVLLQGGFLGFDNNAVSEAARKYPQRIAAGAIDPFCRNAEKILNHLLTLNFCAFKFEVSSGCGLMGSHRTFDIASEWMLSLYDRITQHCDVLAFDIGSPGDSSHQVEAVRKIADTFTNAKIVVCHLVSPRHDQDENIKRELNMLTRDNIFFDTAALFSKVRPEIYPYPSARRYIKYALDTVGAEHLMWGTDAPSTLARETVENQISYCSDLFSKETLDQYLYKTAENVYFRNNQIN